MEGDIYLKELQSAFRLERVLADLWLKCLNNLAEFFENLKCVMVIKYDHRLIHNQIGTS